MPLKECVIGGHNVHCLKEIRFPTVTCSGRCVPRLRKRRCAGVRQGQRGDCAGYGGRRDYRWRGRCRDIDSTNVGYPVVVAATSKRDANQALATSDCWDCRAVGLRKWHGLWCGDQAIMRRGVSGKGGRASWWWGLTRVGAGCVLVGGGFAIPAFTGEPLLPTPTTAHAHCSRLPTAHGPVAGGFPGEKPLPQPQIAHAVTAPTH